MLKIYNSLTRKIEEFVPLHEKHVTMYTCGPTVYSFAHIGNFRTYTTADLLVRTLKLDGYKVEFVMNLTDVGHLTGDNLGDADTGEDRLEKASKKEGKTAWEVAEFYTDAFLTDYQKLHLTPPITFAKATDHIKEQIDLVKQLEHKGFTYETTDGIYFDTSLFKKYGELSNLDQIKEGARVEINPEKRNPRDFALWKFSYPGGKTREEYLSLFDKAQEARDSSPSFDSAQDGSAAPRQMEWESPWGLGFPGWHVECSAMSMKYLGEQLDIHTGGMDLKETHHPNEIAQSEAATGKKFTNYWVHTAFMLVQGERMSKSLGNNYKIYDLEKEGFEPLAMRYLYLQTHYRQEMNFTFPALEAAGNALRHLREEVKKLPMVSDQLSTTETSENEFVKRFKSAMSDDLNTPEALAILWELIKSDEAPEVKLASIFAMDRVLGLQLENYFTEQANARPVYVPTEVKLLVAEREAARKARQFERADQLRNKIKKLGYDIEDEDKKSLVKKV